MWLLSADADYSMIFEVDFQPGAGSHLHVKSRNMLTQLGEWTKLGFFTRTGSGTYALNTPASPASSTNAPDP